MKSKLKELRKEKNLTQVTVCMNTNISQSTISRLEQGTQNFNLEQIIVLSKYFDVTIDYLLGKSEYKNYEAFYFSTNALLSTYEEFISEYAKLTPERQMMVRQLVFALRGV